MASESPAAIDTDKHLETSPSALLKLAYRIFTVGLCSLADLRGGVRAVYILAVGGGLVLLCLDPVGFQAASWGRDPSVPQSSGEPDAARQVPPVKSSWLGNNPKKLPSSSVIGYA